MYTDPIADMLNRIRTAQAVEKESIIVPMSLVKYNIAQVLQKEGFVEEVIKSKKSKKPFFRIVLAYEDENTPKITEIKRISSPGQRIYKKSGELKKIKEGWGFSIISTPEGLMTNKEAKRNNLGGEVICEVW